MKVGFYPLFYFMQENLIKDIEEIIEDIAKYYGCYLVGAVFVSPKKGTGVILRVYIDAEGGVNIDKLTEISRELSMILDVRELIKFKYTLEVSSPGINRIMLKFSDYEKFKGDRVKVSLRNKIEGRFNLTGKIIDVESDISGQNHNIKIFDEISGRIHAVPFFEIKRGNLLKV